MRIKKKVSNWNLSKQNFCQNVRGAISKYQRSVGGPQQVLRCLTSVSSKDKNED